MLSEALEGLRLIRERRWMVAGLSCDVIFNIALGVYFVLGPVVVEQHFDGARDWGLVMTAASVGGLLGSAFVLRVKPKHPLFIAYLVGFATPLQLFALAPPLPLAALMVGAALVFWAIVILNTYWATMEQQHVPPEALSRVDSLAWLASLVVMPAAMFVVGPVSSLIRRRYHTRRSGRTGVDRSRRRPVGPRGSPAPRRYRGEAGDTGAGSARCTVVPLAPLSPRSHVLGP